MNTRDTETPQYPLQTSQLFHECKSFKLASKHDDQHGGIGAHSTPGQGRARTPRQLLFANHIGTPDPPPYSVKGRRK